MKKSAALILFIFLLKTSPGLCQDFWEEIVLPDTLAMSNSDILFDEYGTVFHSIVGWNVRIVNVLGITVYNEKRHADIAGKVICSIQDIHSGFYKVILTKDKEIYFTSFVKY